MKKQTIFDDNLKRLRRELLKLEGTETPIARRNGRRRVLAAARLLRAAVDREFPTMIDRTGIKRLKTFEGRSARLERAGWMIVVHPLIPDFVAAGVPTRRIVHKTPTLGGSGKPFTITAWYVPRWAMLIGLKNTAWLRAAVKSRVLRRGVLTADALVGSVT